MTTTRNYMDFPTAWAHTRASKLEDHDPKCSWVQAQMLCDCHVIWEAERRLRTCETCANNPVEGYDCGVGHPCLGCYAPEHGRWQAATGNNS